MILKEKRLTVMLWLVTVALVWGYVANHLLACVIPEYGRWLERPLFSYIAPIGVDFRLGIYQPAQLLASGASPYDMKNWYPPFMALFGLPFTLLGEDAAYQLQVLLLTVANGACLLLGLRVAGRVFADGGDAEAEKASSVLFAVMAFYAVTSYGFMFSVERGNYDIYAMLFSLVTLWLVIERPTSLWLPVVALSAAAHLKIYPLALLPLLFVRHRWRCLLPLLCVNAVLLLCLGPANMLRFFDQLQAGFQDPLLWFGNHSAASFAKTVLGPLGYDVLLAGKLCLLLPVALWCGGAALLWRRGTFESKAVFLFLLTVPLMHLLPSTSHDYKLVILSAPLAMLLYCLVLDFARKGSLVDALLVGAVVGSMGFMARSYNVTETLWLKNKYPFILVMQVVVLVTLIRYAGLVRRIKVD